MTTGNVGKRIKGIYRGNPYEGTILGEEDSRFGGHAYYVKLDKSIPVMGSFWGSIFVYTSVPNVKYEIL